MLDLRFAAMQRHGATALTSASDERAAPSAQLPADSAIDSALLAFQRDAVERITALLAMRGGAVLADSVGLGKTHVAAALVRAYLHSGGAVLVTGPAPLAAHWRRHLRRLHGWQWRSHTALSRGADWRTTDGTRRLIVVDEAHAFRNPASRRYRRLAELCAGSDGILITATPVNNSIFDFYHIVRLFACEDAFADIGVPDLLGAFEAAAEGRDTAAVRRVVEEICVRRTRMFVERWYRTGGATDRPLHFPRTMPLIEVRYDADARAGGDRHTLRCVERLRFPVHGLHGERAAPELLRFGLLKRLESSHAAFAASLDRHLELLRHFVRAAASGFLFDVTDRRAFVRSEGESHQLTLDAVALRAWPRDLDRRRLVASAERDASLLLELRGRIDSTADVKLATLRDLLAGRLASEQVLVFTEFRDTADHLWRSFAAMGGVALIHGSDARLGRGSASRAAVIRRFAPAANHARTPLPHERVRVLVATDVLAEGLNLQDARAVVSYDLPWNPIRLAQRIGRIDRLGSPHEEILAFSFLPARGIDTMLGLMRRIRRKLRHVRLIGGDAPRFGARSTPASRGAVELLDAAAVVVEELRLRHRELASTPRCQPPAAPDAPPLLAAMPWSQAATICCVAAGSASWFVLVRGRTATHNGREVDSALLAALERRASTNVDVAAARAAMRIACRAVRSRVDARSPVPTRGGRRWAVSTVHAWLRNRPGGPTEADCLTADSLLGRLGEGLPIGVQQSLDRLAAAGADPDSAVDSLRHLLVSQERARRPSTDSRGVHVRAVLLLRPEPGVADLRWVDPASASL